MKVCFCFLLHLCFQIGAFFISASRSHQRVTIRQSSHSNIFPMLKCDCFWNLVWFAFSSKCTTQQHYIWKGKCSFSQGGILNDNYCQKVFTCGLFHTPSSEPFPHHFWRHHLLSWRFVLLLLLMLVIHWGTLYVCMHVHMYSMYVCMYICTF